MATAQDKSGLQNLGRIEPIVNSRLIPTPLIPGKQRWWVHMSLHSKFQASQGFIVRHCLNKIKQNTLRSTAPLQSHRCAPHCNCTAHHSLPLRFSAVSLPSLPPKNLRALSVSISSSLSPTQEHSRLFPFGMLSMWFILFPNFLL